MEAAGQFADPFNITGIQQRLNDNAGALRTFADDTREVGAAFVSDFAPSILEGMSQGREGIAQLKGELLS